MTKNSTTALKIAAIAVSAALLISACGKKSSLERPGQRDEDQEQSRLMPDHPIAMTGTDLRRS